MSGFFKSSIGRKVAMALSALFLMFFLIIHLSVNITSVFSKDIFNVASHFMGTNWLIQFIMQPVLIFGVVYHFVMGFVLELKNRKAVGITYAKNNGAANSTWMSRNMIYSGAFILIFLVIHFLDFWIPEVKYKYIDVIPEDPNRYYEELVRKFVPIWRVALYTIGFIFLSLHLMHGFKSAFQSIGIPSIRKKIFQTCGKIFAIVVPLGFIVIALFHHFNNH